ncbi:MAG: sodium:solute symporter [Phycisphaerales bacterium]
MPLFTTLAAAPTLAASTLAASTGRGMGGLDWAVVAVYLLVLLVSGIWMARREPEGAREYFVASRRMPAWAVGFSIIASSLSVATFIGAPQQSYAGDLSYLSTNIGGVLAIIVVAIFFIPAFYKANVTTVYELLEQRLGRGAKHAASAAFMVGRVFASGARVYIAAIPLAMILFGTDKADDPASLAIAIVVLSFVAVVYTLIGGIASVIWTDVVQVIVLLGAVLAAIGIITSRIPVPLADVWTTLQTSGPDGTSKLTVFKSGFLPAAAGGGGGGIDWSASYTVLTALVGFSLLNLASYGTDHDMVQRMLTCKTAVKGGRSAFIAICMGIPIVAVFLAIGLLLHIFYQRPDLMGAASPTTPPVSSDRVFLAFILQELPAGLSGVMVAGIFAVGLGSLNSAINAMAATLVRDFYTNIVPGRTDRHYLSAGRWATVGWGFVLAGFAVACIFWKRSAPDTKLIDFALGVMNFAYSGLLAVFLCAIFTRRGNSASAVASLLTGFVTVLLLQPAVWKWWTAMLPIANAADIAAFNLAFPWHMLIATSLAFAVCCMGRRPANVAP